MTNVKQYCIFVDVRDRIHRRRSNEGQTTLPYSSSEIEQLNHHRQRENFQCVELVDPLSTALSADPLRGRKGDETVTKQLIEARSTVTFR